MQHATNTVVTSADTMLRRAGAAGALVVVAVPPTWGRQYGSGHKQAYGAERSLAGRRSGVARRCGTNQGSRPPS